MTDIVERLRGSANALQEHIDRLWRPDIDNIREAADEIERLRAALHAIAAGNVKDEIPEEDFGWLAAELQTMARRALGESEG
jgi:HAMP domain-containing protein